MYYCLACNRTHEESSNEELFRTGFHTQPDGREMPLGLCKNAEAVAETRKIS